MLYNPGEKLKPVLKRVGHPAEWRRVIERGATCASETGAMVEPEMELNNKQVDSGRVRASASRAQISTKVWCVSNDDDDDDDDDDGDEEECWLERGGEQGSLMMMALPRIGCGNQRAFFL